MDNGGIEDVPSDSLNFVPRVGDEVEVFKTGTKTIVSKKAPPAPTAADIAGGININVTNANNSSANANVQAPMMGQPIYVGNGKPVNKVVYLLLCFFLGGLGGHKFYAGKIFAGIMYIVFVWTYIPSFLAFIEFIIGVCKKSDANGNIWV